MIFCFVILKEPCFQMCHVISLPVLRHHYYFNYFYLWYPFSIKLGYWPSNVMPLTTLLFSALIPHAYGSYDCCMGVLVFPYSWSDFLVTSMDEKLLKLGTYSSNHNHRDLVQSYHRYSTGIEINSPPWGLFIFLIMILYCAFITEVTD